MLWRKYTKNFSFVMRRLRDSSRLLVGMIRFPVYTLSPDHGRDSFNHSDKKVRIGLLIPSCCASEKLIRDIDWHFSSFLIGVPVQLPPAGFQKLRNRLTSRDAWKKCICSNHQNVSTSFYRDRWIGLYKKKNPSYFEGCTRRIFLLSCWDWGIRTLK